MRDVNHRDVKLVTDPNQIGNDPLLKRRVEVGEWLVEQKELGFGKKRPSERCALFFSAREARHSTVEQRINFKDPDNVAQAEQVMAFALLCPLVPIKEISANGHVRKESKILWNVSDLSTPRGDANTTGGILKHALIKLNTR